MSFYHGQKFKRSLYTPASSLVDSRYVLPDDFDLVYALITTFVHKIKDNAWQQGPWSTAIGCLIPVELWSVHETVPEVICPSAINVMIDAPSRFCNAALTSILYQILISLIPRCGTEKNGGQFSPQVGTLQASKPEVTARRMCNICHTCTNPFCVNRVPVG